MPQEYLVFVLFFDSYVDNKYLNKHHLQNKKAGTSDNTGQIISTHVSIISQISTFVSDLCHLLGCGFREGNLSPVTCSIVMGKHCCKSVLLEKS